MTNEVSPFLKPRMWGLRFSVRGLMLMVFGLAAGLASLDTKYGNWGQAASAPFVLWFALGLIHQARDLWVAYHGQRDLSLDERCGWWFAAGWRLTAVILLAAFYLLWILRTKVGLFPAAENRDHYLISPDVGTVLDGVFWLTLVIILASVPRGPRHVAPWQRVRAALTNVGGALLGLVLAARLLVQEGLPWFLVFIAINGIDASSPPSRMPAWYDLDLNARTERFLTITLAAAAIAALNIGLTAWMARRPRACPTPCWLVLLLTLGIGAASCYPAWVYLAGLPELSPSLNGVVWTTPVPTWWAGGLLVAVLVTGITGRATLVAGEPAPASGVGWRQRSGGYFHEWPWLVGLYALALAVGGTYALLSDWWSRHSLLDSWGEVLGQFCSEPRKYLAAAAFLAACQAAWGAWRRPVALDGPPRLPPGRFALVWFAVLCTTLTTLSILTGLVFAYWLTPWYRFDWP